MLKLSTFTLAFVVGCCCAIARVTGRGVSAFAVLPTRCGRGTTNRDTQRTTCFATGQINTSFMWNAGLNFGKGQFKFYNGFDEWMKVFPDEDRRAYAEVFNIPEGMYEVKLTKPLGIIFEEIEVGRGLVVTDIVPGGAAAQNGRIRPGDYLVGITAVKIVGAKYERRLIPSRKFDFDTMVGAIQSNEPKWGCYNVILMMQRPNEISNEKVDEFMAFFEPPFDNPWKQQQ